MPVSVYTKLPFGRVNHVSKLFQPLTNPAKNVVIQNKQLLPKNQKLMLDLGVIRQSNTGVYHLLPLGLRAMKKLKNLISTYMHLIGAQELKFPLLVNSDLWKQSGRWPTAGDEVFKLNDRHKNEFFLSPTNEECAAHLIADIPPMNEKQFPLLIYQINSKFRDEMKPRCGLIRGREFIMKDLYSFDTSLKSAEATYEYILESYEKIFAELNLDVVKVKADPGDIGGLLSHEFHIKCKEGEETLKVCQKCKTPSVEHEIKSCENCNHSLFEETTSLEIGHTFLLGTKYTEPLLAKFATNAGKFETLFMGSYGLGLTRILAGLLETNSLSEEIRWPLSIAPYHIIIIPPKEGSKEELAVPELSLEIYKLLDKMNYLDDNVVMDDRTHLTIGKRVVYAKRTGYPYIVVIGSKSTLKPPLVELIDVYKSESTHMTVEQLLSYFHEQPQPDKLFL